MFDSNRARAPTDPVNSSFLCWMKADGTHQTFLTKGGSPAWSPDSKYIAFHASASGNGLPINTRTAEGHLKRVLKDWREPYSGYHL